MTHTVRETPSTSLLVFEVPIERANHLKLELPVEAYGGNGDKELKLKIPKTSITKTEDVDPWKTATERVTDGQLTVEIYEVAIGKVELSNAKGDTTSTADLLKFRLQITNHHGDDPINYKGWSRLSGDVPATSLKDSAGHRYQLVKFPIGTHVFGQKSRKAVYEIDSNKQIQDVLVFELPFEGADFLWLELPKNAIGSDDSEVLRLKYPVRKIKTE